MTLHVDGVSYAYGAKPALDGVGFRAERGRFTALLGPNGAGKSTLFGLLSGLLTTRSGRIEVAGHDMARAPRAALAAMGIVFQQTTLDLDLTVRQNLRYFAALRGLSGRAAGPRIDAALERLNMAERAGEKVRALNGGHRRRTEIARALLHNPQVLLLDEPTVGLDAAARRGITDHVHDLARDGMAVLWATHLTDEVAADDHLLVLHRGRVLADGPATDVTGNRPLAETFLTMTSTPA
ncbi:ABC transporter ATP-binding protein [Jannaschia pagri]|uniref:ABC transporter ATP-binding protein n=1 Tax=Jannaschia pagri TaxID=2829797 RepID=A0ABQ4NIW5_9RHOB|nr:MULTISPECIES: ABC transporter ATP-binding protein [unclassified Jannaschia]GIT89549.1 ABC transporter ATP-binding protein [Jannaschia sp. AI_61]GIT94343.1 ABC transporter ATP-binding protein [Jannaschia sp. AI_62]